MIVTATMALLLPEPVRFRRSAASAMRSDFGVLKAFMEFPLRSEISVLLGGVPFASHPATGRRGTGFPKNDQGHPSCFWRLLYLCSPRTPLASSPITHHTSGWFLGGQEARPQVIPGRPQACVPAEPCIRSSRRGPPWTRSIFLGQHNLRSVSASTWPQYG